MVTIQNLQAFFRQFINFCLPINEVLNCIGLIFILLIAYIIDKRDLNTYWCTRKNFSLCLLYSAGPKQLTFLTNGPHHNKDLDQYHPDHCVKVISFLPSYEAYKDTFLDTAHSFQELVVIPFSRLCLTWKFFIPLIEGPIRSQSVLLDSCIMTKAVGGDLGSGTLHLFVYTYLILMIKY